MRDENCWTTGNLNQHGGSFVIFHFWLQIGLSRSSHRECAMWLRNLQTNLHESHVPTVKYGSRCDGESLSPLAALAATGAQCHVACMHRSRVSLAPTFFFSFSFSPRECRTVMSSLFNFLTYLLINIITFNYYYCYVFSFNLYIFLYYSFQFILKLLFFTLLLLSLYLFSNSNYLLHIFTSIIIILNKNF